VSVISLLTVGVLWWRVSGTSLPAVDRIIEGWVISHRTPALTFVFSTVTWTGSSLVVVPLVVVLAWVAWRVVGGKLAALILLLQVGNVAATQGLKALTSRMRPSASPLGHAAGAAFPSGHSSNSVVVLGGTAVLLAAFLGGRHRVIVGSVRVALVVVAALVGISRVYLDVHWTTDVVAGWALGASWLPVLWLAARAVGRPGGNPAGEEQEGSTTAPRGRLDQAGLARPSRRGTRWEHVLLARHDAR